MNVPAAMLSTAALAAAAGIQACSLERPFPECPHNYDLLRVQVDQRRVATVRPPLLGPGPTRNIPEYHDCQRFVVTRSNGGLAYDSLFAIFRTIDSLPAPTSEAVPFAEILAWNDYDPLGLTRGQNCLYMWPRAPATIPPEWEARMVHTANWGQEGKLTCAQRVPVDSLPQGRDLDVAATLQDLDLPAGAFPQVARWGWSRSHRVQTINLNCAAAWCEVLPRGVDPTPSYFDELQSQGQTPTGSQGTMLRYMVSGWYDEQLLAYNRNPDDPSSSPEPTGILGRFFPHESLGSLGLGDFGPTPNKPWTLVGYISLDVPDGEPATHLQKYKDTYGLDSTSPTAPFSQMNKLYLCYGPRLSCGVPLIGVNTCPGGDWWARVEPPNGPAKIRCVTRRGHSGPPPDVPATARWRWAIYDEGSWERCVQGCCEMIGDS